MARILYLQIIDESVRKLYETAVKKREFEFSKYHGEQHIDSGFDIFTPAHNKAILIHPGQTSKLRLGIRCAVFTEYGIQRAHEYQDRPAQSQPYYIYPRSSMSKSPLRLANSVGVIDSGYRGELMAMVDNIESDNPYNVHHGQRLFQICMPDLQPFKVKIVDQLDETTRGSGGFGSTGL